VWPVLSLVRIAFQQIGSVCYSPSPATIGITMPLDEKDRTINEEQAKNSVSVDSSLPVTTVQIRLADGSRLVGQFNHSHTIADVRRFITVYPLYKSHVIRAVILWGTIWLGNVEISRWCLNYQLYRTISGTDTVFKYFVKFLFIMWQEINIQDIWQLNVELLGFMEYMGHFLSICLLTPYTHSSIILYVQMKSDQMRMINVPT